MNATIQRYTAVNRMGFLLGATILFAAPGYARAQSFDLDCRQIQTAYGGTYGKPRMHLQIDLVAGKWCADECTSIEPVIKSDAGLLTLLDGTYNFGDRRFRSVDLSGGKLVEILGVGESYERKLEFLCRSESFGSFAPYLARDAVPQGDLGRSIYAAGFPMDADGKALAGRVGFRIEVDANGIAKGCTISQSSGDAVLDQRVCPLIMNSARFRPATDRTGKAIAGSYESAVRWISAD